MTALRKASRKARLGHVELVGPLTKPDRLRRIDRAANAFVYLVARQGVTGVRNGSFDAVVDLVLRTTAVLTNPLCLGFGLSKPEQVMAAFGAGASIAVVGSHLARVIVKAWEEETPDRDLRVVELFTEALRPLVTAGK